MRLYYWATTPHDHGKRRAGLRPGGVENHAETRRIGDRRPAAAGKVGGSIEGVLPKE
jgi:hypothetical protein